jgi:predicted HAD superfamily Cof-like phosphohydrolase
MEKQLQQRKEFNEVYGCLTQESPQFPKKDIQELQEKLIAEELEEFRQANENEDMVEATDALVDLLYVVYGAAISYGLEDVLEAAFDEVHESNMSKLDEDGNPILREDGKILKGENYFPPDLKSIIEKHQD